MKQETIKIQQGNDTTLCIRPILHDGTALEYGTGDGQIYEVEVQFGTKGHFDSPISWTWKDGYVCIPISRYMPVGAYDVRIAGVVCPDEGHSEFQDSRHEMFEIVPYGNGIRYDKYYGEFVIVGLPDSLLERLKAEYEAKRDEYQHLVDELNRGEVATKADLGLLPGETVAGLIKAGGGGGGGGGLTPEQWAQIAKEQTLESVGEEVVNGFNKTNLVIGTADQQPERKGSLMQRAGWCNTTLANLVASISTVQGKLDTIIANTSLTAAQADEDWQNVQPINA